ncbi:SDR family NAD(P)-dependent oxidoreductase [Kribbella ginsengisoli]|uniref:SDR family NAD(P)-dependent oxidoreductase n=1 Tax=Kribbella ginsengisoli TaxID=363865 RepID=A0ABP6YSA7_9ACTN
MSVWFVTGASRGFGAELVKEAVARGNQVVATARRPDDIPDQQGVLRLTLDVTDEAQARAAVDAAVQEFGRIDVVVNNAGRGLLGAVEEASDEAARAVFDTNVFGVPGLFRTDFLDGSSLHRADGEIADYAETAGAMRQIATEGNHAQPGDPAKAAAAIVALTEAADPPLRIQLGADSVGRVEAKLDQVRSELEQWRKVSVGTDHDDA